MKGDYSRFSFDAKKHYRAVLMQQGRLQLDSDWNEQVQMMEHRYNAFFRSMVGRSGTPKYDEMKLDRNGKEQLILTKGVFYIDGLLIENENSIVLPESLAAARVSLLYYIDAWSREVSAAEDDNLIDSAIALETTTRLKTEWMVRCQLVDWDENASESFEGGNWPVADKIKISGDWWKNLSTGTLTLTPLKTSNKAIKDNRLYRVEVHQNAPGSSEYMFKWSADNAGTCTEITAETESTFKLKNDIADMRDAFQAAPYIELLIPGKTGEREEFRLMLDMRDKKKGNSFSPKGILTLGKDDAKAWESIKEALVKAKQEFKIIIRLWDGASLLDVNKGSSFALPGVASCGFSQGFYRHGDYWLVQTRNGEVVNWDIKAKEKKPPDGVEHHFAALGIVDSSSKEMITPLRVLFEPLTSRDFSTTENTSFGGDLTVGGKLTVKGETELNGALTVNANILGNLTIGDTRIRNGKLTVHWETELNGSLAVNSTANITGNTTIGGTANITGLTTIGTSKDTVKRLEVYEATTLGTSGDTNIRLTVYGATAINGVLSLSGDLYINGVSPMIHEQYTIIKPKDGKSHDLNADHTTSLWHAIVTGFYNAKNDAQLEECYAYKNGNRWCLWVNTTNDETIYVNVMFINTALVQNMGGGPSGPPSRK
jgi:hypothetical protein